jgi:hypothetical protein
MAYFWTLYFVLGVCKQQQMSTQLCKILGDALSEKEKKTKKET